MADHRVILARSCQTLVEESTVVEHTMDVHGWLRKQLEETSSDLLRAMVKEMAEALMSADADRVCGAGWGERSLERVNRRNGYRERNSGSNPLVAFFVAGDRLRLAARRAGTRRADRGGVWAGVFSTHHLLRQERRALPLELPARPSIVPARA